MEMQWTCTLTYSHYRALSNNDSSHDELPFYVCHASLLTEDGDSHVDFAHTPNEPNSAPVRMLYGALVTTPYQVHGEVIFPFTDLGVRYSGLYRLQISLFRLARYV